MTRGESFGLLAVIALLVGLIGVAIEALLQVLDPGWNIAFLPPVLALVTLEAAYSVRYHPWGTLNLMDGVPFRVVEVALLVVAVLAVNALAQGQDPSTALSPSIDGRTASLLLLVASVWLAGRSMGEIVLEMEHPDFSLPGWRDPVRVLSVRLLVGGIILFLVAGLTQPHVAQDIHLPHAAHGPAWEVLAYFLLGVPALAAVHYLAKRNRWQAQRMAVAPGLSGRWVRYTVLFLAVVLLLALLLPTRETVGAYQLLSGMWGWLSKPLLHLMKPSAPPPGSTHIAQPPLKLPFHGPGQGKAPTHHWPAWLTWLGNLRPLVFWALVSAVLLLILRALAQRRARLGGLQFASLWAAGKHGLAALWTMLRRALGWAGKQLALHLPEGVVRGASVPVLAVPALLHRVRTGALSPREQVQRYYRLVVQRAGRHGIEREPSQTPHEYGAVLAGRLGEAEPEFHGLTEAFIEARYSRHPVGEPEVSTARTRWQRIRQALRRMR